MKIIGFILIVISAFTINDAVGFQIQVGIGEIFLICGVWLFAWKAFLKAYKIDIDGNKLEE